MHDGMPYDLIQGQGQGHTRSRSQLRESHSRAVECQSRMGLILIVIISVMWMGHENGRCGWALRVMWHVCAVGVGWSVSLARVYRLVRRGTSSALRGGNSTSTTSAGLSLWSVLPSMLLTRVN